MMLVRALTVLIWSMACSLATAFAFAMSTGGRVNPATLALPAVSTIAALFGGTAGLVLWPYMYWSLKGRSPFPTVLILTAIAAVVVSSSTVISPRIGLIASVIYWTLSLLVVRLLYA